jgi:hypothetical protein
MKGTEYSVSLQTSVVLTEECNVIVNSEELIGTYRRISGAIYEASHIRMSL